MYIISLLNHLKVLQGWATSRGAQARLDVVTFELELKARNRCYRMQPQFIASINGQLAHVTQISPLVSGFIGWLPYRPVAWPIAEDKLAFKQFMREAGLPTPDSAPSVEPMAQDYLLKRSSGSFGYELRGPFKAGSAPSIDAADLARPGKGRWFAERFMQGRNVKAWFWGRTPAYLHLQDYPEIRGDARTPVIDLVQRRVGASSQRVNARDLASISSSLAFQGWAMGDVLPADATAWIDYRYGRIFQSFEQGALADDALPSSDAHVREQIRAAGNAVGGQMLATFPAPLLYTLDGVLDAQGRLWWLEMNTNPVLPPDAYTIVLDSLFDTRPPAAATPPAIANAPVGNAAPHSLPPHFAPSTEPEHHDA